jgi:FAD/FMN-containing dehydrogenase
VHIPIQITVPRVEADRILADPAPDLRVVVPCPVVLQRRLYIILTPGEGVQGLNAGICLPLSTAVAVVADVVLVHASGIHQVARGAEVICEQPVGITPRLLVGVERSSPDGYGRFYRARSATAENSAATRTGTPRRN